MSFINAEKYIDERLNNQIEWYSNKSSGNKKLHYLFRIVELSTTAIIAIMSLNIDCPYFSSIIGSMGVILTSLYSIHIFCKFQENWIEYRKTSEILKHEKYMFLARSGVYNSCDESDVSFKILVERCETVISHENINWAQLNSNEYIDKKCN